MGDVSAGDWKVRGDNAALARDFKKAIACYSKAIDLDPTNHVYLGHRAESYLSKHDPTNALVDSETCINLNPLWPKGFGHKGAALYELGDFSNSIEVYKQGLSMEPDNVQMKKALANVQKTVQKYPLSSSDSFYQAARDGHIPALNALLRMGCKVEEYYITFPRSDKMTALGGAILCGQEEAVKLLLRAGADPTLDQQSEGCRKPTMLFAVEGGNARIVKLLLEAGGSANLDLDMDGLTLLHMATFNEKEEMVKVLLDAGANVEALATGRLSPLSIAVTTGCVGIVKRLLKAGASLTGNFTEDNLTVLHIAASVGYEDVVEVLLAAGADANALSEGMMRGQLPIEFARMNGNTEAVKLLTEAENSVGASSDSGGKGGEKRKKDKKGRTCDGPSCHTLGVKKCKACRRRTYCGMECQRAHWNAGHREECQRLRESS